MFITGPDVVRSVMQENSQPGRTRRGADPQPVRAASATSSPPTIASALTESARTVELPAVEQPGRSTLHSRRVTILIGAALSWSRSSRSTPQKPYDVRQVITSLVDDGRFFEVHALWAQNMVVGFARLDGYVVGLVANQPMVLAGTIDIKASIKATHFIRICDAYNIPIITLQDVPGFLPGTSPGVRRDHPQRRAPDLCLQRGDGAQADADPAQELRWRLLCDEQQRAARRSALCLAQCRTGGDGCGRRGEHPLPQRGQGRRRSRRRAAAN
jgi:hypothetical protein